MDWRLRVPSAVYRRALARAGSEAALASHVIRWLERYIDPPPSAQSLGGQAAAAALSPLERRTRAQIAARARWQRPPEP